MRILTVLRAHWDRTLAAALVLVGAIAITSAAVQARETILAFEQLTLLITGGITGLALIAVGLATWLSADLRDEWRQMKTLEDAILAASEEPVAGDRRAVLVVDSEAPAVLIPAGSVRS